MLPVLGHPMIFETISYRGNGRDQFGAGSGRLLTQTQQNWAKYSHLATEGGVEFGGGFGHSSNIRIRCRIVGRRPAWEAAAG